MSRAAKHSSVSVAHFTPEDVVERARRTLGGIINLDPFSCEFANRVVRATIFYDGQNSPDGFTAPWQGHPPWYGHPSENPHCLVNPPGGSLPSPLFGTKSSQAAAWCKTVAEWSAGRVRSAVFVGFSLELLQAVQLSEVRVHPLELPTCVPARRIRFDVRARDRRAALEAELRSLDVRPAADRAHPGRRAALERELAELAPAAEADLRWPGDQPTHGNILVLLPGEKIDVERFRVEFGPIGIVSIPTGF